MMGDNEEGNITDQAKDEQQPFVQEQPLPKTGKKKKRKRKKKKAKVIEVPVGPKPKSKRLMDKIRRKRKAKYRRQAKFSLPHQLNARLNETFRRMSCINCQLLAGKGRSCPYCCSLICKPCLTFWFKKSKGRSCYRCRHVLTTKQRFVKLDILPQLGKSLKAVRESVTKEIFNLRMFIGSVRVRDRRDRLQQEQGVINIGDDDGRVQVGVMGNEQPDFINNQQGPAAGNNFGAPQNFAQPMDEDD